MSHLIRNTALVVVDLQRYYLERESSYLKYHIDHLQLDLTTYFINRCQNIIIPNVRKLQSHFRENKKTVIYLRLCGTKKDRSDLHRFFYEFHKQGDSVGVHDIYPLEDDPMSAIIDSIQPESGEHIICKTTFSPFTSTGFNQYLKSIGIKKLVMTGITTSQCVDTTARDASDHGFDIVHIEDAQADFDERIHLASLFSSRGVCGGDIYTTRKYIEDFSQRSS